MGTVAIIPARGGSKGIPGKNLIDIAGKPLLAWSIIAAKLSPQISEVFVTSDSSEILNIAEMYGAKTILRPIEISGDTASSESAILHAVSLVPNEIDTVVMLQATSPLRRRNDIDNALTQFKKHRLDSLFSSALLLDFLIWEESQSDGLNSMNYDWKNRGRRQDRKPQYVETGSFYIFKKQEFIKAENRMFGNVGMFLQEFWQSFEIDEPGDIDFIRCLFNLHQLNVELCQ